MEIEPTPLDYRSPQSAPTRGVFNEAACYAGIIIAMVLLVDLLFVVPRFEAIFKDFGTKLPVMTEWLLIASRWTRGGLWVLFVVLPVPFGFLVALVQPVGPEPEESGDVRTPRRGRPRRWWIFRLVALAIVVIALVTVFALFLPMITLIQAVSKS
jgi:type IV pilus assembly protein PilC